jgi:Fe-S-cluster containining protein
MGNIIPEDARQIATLSGITRESLAGSAPIDVRDCQCNRCGACCRDQDGIIISLNDAHLLSVKLGLPLKNFVRKYCRTASSYDIFGHGPYQGIALKTKKGVCTFYADNAGCTVNDAKPMVCRLYPFNTIHVTRASILKMQRKKDGGRYDDCFIFQPGNDGLILPDFAAIAAHCIRMETTRDYYRQYGDRWQDDQAHNAVNTGARLSANRKSLDAYVRQLKIAFDEFDRRNGKILLDMFPDDSAR